MSERKRPIGQSKLLASVAGVLAGVGIFLLIGVKILFAVSYSAVHGASDLMAGLLIVGSWLAVLGGCIWLGVAVQRTVAKGR